MSLHAHILPAASDWRCHWKSPPDPDAATSDLARVDRARQRGRNINAAVGERPRRRDEVGDLSDKNGGARATISGRPPLFHGIVNIRCLVGAALFAAGIGATLSAV
jgi:hypothetical protein